MERLPYTERAADLASMVRFTTEAFVESGREAPEALREVRDFVLENGGEHMGLNGGKVPRDLAQMWNMVPYASGIRGSPAAAAARAVREALGRKRRRSEADRASLLVELSSGYRPTELAFVRDGRVVRAVDPAEVAAFGGEFDGVYGEADFANFAALEAARPGIARVARVATNDGYDALGVFEEFCAVLDDDAAFAAVQERYA